MKPFNVLLSFICHGCDIGGVLLYDEDTRGDPWVDAGRGGNLKGELGG